MAMRDRGAEVLEPFEPAQEPTYDWDYEEEPEYRSTPRPIWGRIAALIGFILLAFIIGRLTAGGGIPEEQLTEARAQRDAARAQAADLTQERDELQQQVIALRNAAENTPADTATEEDTTAPAEDGEATETYTVQEGDTLLEIATQECGDPAAASYIAEANELIDPDGLLIGSELVIPPACNN